MEFRIGRGLRVHISGVLKSWVARVHVLARRRRLLVAAHSDEQSQQFLRIFERGLQRRLELDLIALKIDQSGRAVDAEPFASIADLSGVARRTVEAYHLPALGQRVPRLGDGKAYR